MTRSELIQHIAQQFPMLTPQDAEVGVRHLLEQMSDALVQGGRIEIRDFDSFSLHQRPARMVRNPKTGEAVAVPARVAPHFKPGKELRERVDRQA